MRKKVIVIVIIFIVCIIGIIALYKNKSGNKVEEINNREVEIEDNILDSNYAEEIEEDKDKIDEIKQDSGITSNEDIYTVIKEDNGRETIVINPKVEYKVALAGIIKKDNFKLNEIDEIIKDVSNKAGIWVNEESREKFLKMVNDNTKSTYYIDDEGYLKIENKELAQNENDKIIQNKIAGENLYNIDMSGQIYNVDTVTGEITLYPFEKMDNMQTYEYCEYENRMVIILNSNKENKLRESEILQEMLNLINLS